VTDAPADIWLVYGELEHDDTHWTCCRDGEVHYVRGDRYDDLCTEIERLRAALTESCDEHRSEIYDTATGGGCILLHDAVAAERERCATVIRQAMPQPVANWSDAQIVDALRGALDRVLGPNDRNERIPTA
jgi:hypothetical protein